MRKYLFLLTFIFALSFSAHAQNDNSVYFYGVDFSDVKVIAAVESEQDFATAFSGINLLLINEQDKYDFSRVMHKRLHVYPDNMIEESLSNDYSNMKVYRYQDNEIDINAKVKSYKLSQESGQGLVLIAQYLDKTHGTASYIAVLFDIATRQVISHNKLISKAGGFGLRNYWARTVYNLTLRESLFY